MPNEKDFEKQNVANILRAERAIKRLYEGAIEEIVPAISSIKVRGERFLLKDYPALNNRVAAQIKKLQPSVYTVVVNSIKDGWDLSNKKNDFIVDRRLAGRKAPSAVAEQILYDPNKKALDSFIKRKEGGLNLSNRIWTTLSGYRTEMEAVIGVGVAEGKDAREIANGLKRFLVEPDKLFRRVRSIKGDPTSKLKLSKAAEAYHPGAGIYRSSYLNARRVSRTETNIAYRLADIERYKKLPFIKGYKIVLSNQHPRYDICDELNKSIYPKDFVWSGWHPQCLCHMESVQISDKEFNQQEDEILGLGKAPKIDMIEGTPQVFNKWVEANKGRIEGWKSKPYWYRDNKGLIEQGQRVLRVATPSPKLLPDRMITEDGLTKSNRFKGVDVYVNNAATGRSINEIDDLIEASGIPKDWEDRVRVKFLGQERVSVSTTGNGVKMFRTIDKVDRIIKNEFFEIADDSRYKGMGTKLFADQVDAATKQGYKKIEVEAAGSFKKSMNGYYTWARLGYTSKKSAVTATEQQSNIREALSNFNRENKTKLSTLQELMATKLGRDFWKVNGRTWFGEFNLEANSINQKILSEYLKERNK